MPTVITQGAASAKGYGFGARATAANYIEDVFSTYLYTGTGANRTISNGIDLSTKGGAVWIKSRSTAANGGIFDTARGANKRIQPDATVGQTTDTNGLNSFATDGFNLGTGANEGKTNTSGVDYVSWTFRKQAKFFDIVTFTSSAAGVSTTINHSLGSSPGCVIVKALGGANENWWTWHRSLSSTQYLALNTTAAEATGTPTITVSSTQVVFGANWLGNPSTSYVAYLFAHDAGGFGAAGTDNVISCGSYTGTGTSGNFVSLGYEPQWLLIKRTDAAPYNWFLLDNIRGIATGSGNDLYLNPNLSDAEGSATQIVAASAAGFTLEGPSTGLNASGGTYIYIAIRRGPMKTPTSGTSVFSPIASSAATGTALTTSFPVDMQIFSLRTGVGNKNETVDRLRGVSTNSTESGARLITSSTLGEATGSIPTLAWNNTSFQVVSTFGGSSMVYWNFRRAPGFFDEVCYTGTGSVTTFNHNLGIAPELMIVKRRNATSTWRVYSNALTSAAYALTLNSTAAEASLTTVWNSTAPTSSVFSVGTSTDTNASGGTYVAYLFGTVAGVSKVGSYTGNGTTKQIDCGFTGGARFVLIKRTDSTGDWYVWDSARGIVAANDPYLLLNLTAAEVTSTDYIDTYSAGFEISSTAPAAINANGGSFIFLAIA